MRRAGLRARHVSASRCRARTVGAPLLAAALLIALVACDRLPGKPTAAEKPLRPEQVTDFDVLYNENCSGCHGRDGRLAAARPMNDPIYLALVGVDRLQQITAAGVPGTGMPGFAPAAGGMLTDAQVGILARGIVARWAAGGAPAGVRLPPYAAPPGDAQRGSQVYLSHCAGCHGADGRGGKQGGSVVDGAFLGLVSDQALRSAVICGRIDLGMPDWRGEAAQQAMSEQDVADVVGWLIAQRPRFPGQPYASAK